MMTPRARILWTTVMGLGLIAVLSGFQIGDYPFNTKAKAKDKAKVQQKIYKDLPEEEIKAIMKQMASEIGVKCNYCHNEKNYASFENPNKEFAQYKIYMVEWLNTKYRPANATWKYSCYTCHRGELKPANKPPVPPR